MYAFALLILIVLVGIAVQAAVSFATTDRLTLSRSWYLGFGLILMLPTMGYPMALLAEIRNPTPQIHTFNLPLSLVSFLGLYLVIRFFITNPARSRASSPA